MRLNAIKEHISNFKQHLNSSDKYEHQYLYDYLMISPVKIQSINTLLSALKGSTTTRLWNRENYNPKTNMLAIWQDKEQEFTLAMETLFNAHYSIEACISKFKFYNDLARDNYNKKNPLKKIHEDHVDNQFISILLSMVAPEKFNFFHPSLFFSICKKINATPQPIVEDINRFYKISEIYFKSMQGDPEFIHLLKQRNINTKEIIPKNLVSECMILATGVDVLS